MSPEERKRKGAPETENAVAAETKNRTPRREPHLAPVAIVEIAADANPAAPEAQLRRAARAIPTPVETRGEKE